MRGKENFITWTKQLNQSSPGYKLIQEIPLKNLFFLTGAPLDCRRVITTPTRKKKVFSEVPWRPACENALMLSIKCPHISLTSLLSSHSASSKISNSPSLSPYLPPYLSFFTTSLSPLNFSPPLSPTSRATAGATSVASVTTSGGANKVLGEGRLGLCSIPKMWFLNLTSIKQ